MNSRLTPRRDEPGGTFSSVRTDTHSQTLSVSAQWRFDSFSLCLWEKGKETQQRTAMYVVDRIPYLGNLYTEPTNATCPSPVAAYALIASMVQTMIRIRDERSTRASPPDDLVTDFVVVGAGAAGAAVAARLADRWNVALLEAGGDEPPEANVPGYNAFLWGSQIDWMYRTEPQKGSCGGTGCSWPRGKCLGGSSSINSMMYVRGNPRDFDHWRDLGNPGWGYEDLLPYFKKSEDNLDPEIARNTRYHGKGGPQSVQRFAYRSENVDVIHNGFQELGFNDVDVNAKDLLGVTYLQFMAKNGERWSTNRAYLEPLRRSKKGCNLRVLTHALVSRVIIENGRAVGVEYITKEGWTRRIRARKEVIICGGTINSAQILMLSGIGPKAHLRSLGIPVIADLPVGENLQDHATANLFTFYLTQTSTEPNGFYGWKMGQRQYERDRSGPFASMGSLQVFTFVRSETGRRKGVDENYPDLQLTFSPNLDQETCVSGVDEASKCAGETRTLECQKTSYPYFSGISVTPTFLRPTSRGCIKLRSRDPRDAPLLYPNYFSTNDDLEPIVDGFMLAMNLSRTETLRKRGFKVKTAPLEKCSQHRFGTRDYFRCGLREYTSTNYHIAGTCKMGPDGDRTSVVDPRLRVRGIRNLRVIDNSIMPYVTSGNTFAPTLAIAEKGADMIKEDWRS